MNEYAKMIRVWRWQDAPEEFRALSTHGGDEDWVAVVPAHLVGTYIPWMDSGTGFGCCSVYGYMLPTGEEVRIGAHA